MGLKEDLQDIKDRLAKQEAEQLDKKKPKKFKIPWGKRVTPKQASQNFVTVIKINENGFLDFRRDRIIEQTIFVDGIPRLATPDYVLHYKKNPVIIQPSWSVKPYSPQEAFNIKEDPEPYNPQEAVQRSLDDGSNIKGYKILMARMKSDSMGNNKPPMGNMIKWVLGLGLAAIVGYAFLTGGGA